MNSESEIFLSDARPDRSVSHASAAPPPISISPEKLDRIFSRFTSFLCENVERISSAINKGIGTIPITIASTFDLSSPFFFLFLFLSSLSSFPVSRERNDGGKLREYPSRTYPSRSFISR